ncbi:hypothetical protein NF27_DP01110 [Candidatus Jidaibacter acanthamoeba]|uniref:Uncharacterized protein n=1 Tax=Candidatus Jidaibacter acanthamoebae TaxID=86105 RepID=A0A0C1MTZ7_9RICK|nr:hypothetical protein NF27_DP01110 [Candidatus Jidaibacter acanthamoeba]
MNIKLLQKEANISNEKLNESIKLLRSYGIRTNFINIIKNKMH